MWSKCPKNLNIYLAILISLGILTTGVLGVMGEAKEGKANNNEPLQITEVRRRNYEGVFNWKKITFQVKKSGQAREDVQVTLDNLLQEKTNEKGLATFKIPLSGHYQVWAKKGEESSNTLQVNIEVERDNFGPSYRGISTLGLHPDFLNANYIEIVQFIGITPSGKVLAEEPISSSEWVKRKIESAHELGKKVLLVLYPEWYKLQTGERHSWGGKGETEIGPVPNNREVMKRLKEVVLGYAEMAENLGVEMLTPTCELNIFIGWDEMVTWHEKSMPAIRDVYSGHLIPKLDAILWDKKYDLEPKGDLSFYNYFRFYDFATSDLFLHQYQTIDTFEDYGEAISEQLSYLTTLKEKHDLQGIILGPEINLNPSSYKKLQQNYPNRTLAEIKRGMLKEIFESSFQFKSDKRLKIPIEQIKSSCYGEIDMSKSEFALSELGKECVIEEWLQEHQKEHNEKEEKDKWSASTVDGFFFWQHTFLQRYNDGQINKKSLRITREYFSGDYMEEVYGKGFELILDALSTLSNVKYDCGLTDNAKKMLIRAMRNYEEGELRKAQNLSRKSVALSNIAIVQEALSVRNSPDKFDEEAIEKLKQAHRLAIANDNTLKSISLSEEIIQENRFEVDGLKNEWDESLKILDDPIRDSKPEKSFDISSVCSFSTKKYLYLMIEAVGDIGFSRKLENYPDYFTINLNGGANLVADIPDYMVDTNDLVKRAEPKEVNRVKVMWDDVLEIRIPLKHLEYRDNTIEFNIELSDNIDRTETAVYELNKGKDQKETILFLNDLLKSS